MVRVLKTVLVGCGAAIAFLTGSVDGWAQTQTQPAAALPRFDVAAGVAFRQVADNADASRTWTGPGLSLGVDANVSEHLAIATSVERYAQAGTAVLGGVQLSTGFYYGSGRDPVPGRFFTRLLVGGIRGGADATHAGGQVDVGADVLLSRSRGVGFRWQIGYDLVPGDERNQASGRAAIGLVFGPHLSRPTNVKPS